MVLEICFQMLQDRFIKMLNLNSIWKIYENLTFHNQNISLVDIDGKDGSTISVRVLQ